MMIQGLVDGLGMLAGAVWMCGALYFQFIRGGRVHPAFVSVLFLIGVALMMGSSAIAFAGRPSIVGFLAVFANVLFIILGLGAWYGIEKHASIQEAKSIPEDCVDA